jgi:hypothetical protein
MSSFFEKLDRGSPAHIWFPRGLWSPEELRAICADLGLVPGWNRVEDLSPQPEGLRYLRLEGPRYDDDTLYRLADRLPRQGRTLCLLSTVNMVHEAIRLQTLLGL